MAGKSSEATATDEELATLFACSTRTIRELAKASIVIKGGPNEYLRDASITNYTKHLRAAAAGRSENRRGGDELSPIDALRIEQRLLIEAKRRAMEGELIPYDQIQPAWGRVATAVRQHVLGLPAKARFALPHLTPHDGQVLDELCRDCLESAAMTDTPPAPDAD